MQIRQQLRRAAGGSVLLCALVLSACESPESISDDIAERKRIDVCALVSSEQLGQLYRVELLPNPNGRGCYWNKSSGGMAYMDIRIRDADKELREFFNTELSDTTKLEPVNDLGDGGLMTIVDGSLGVIVVKKNDRVLQSAVTFLDIEPNSPEKDILWEVYRNILSEF